MKTVYHVTDRDGNLTSIPGPIDFGSRAPHEYFDFHNPDRAPHAVTYWNGDELVVHGVPKTRTNDDERPRWRWWWR